MMWRVSIAAAARRLSVGGAGEGVGGRQRLVLAVHLDVPSAIGIRHGRSCAVAARVLVGALDA